MAAPMDTGSRQGRCNDRLENFSIYITSFSFVKTNGSALVAFSEEWERMMREMLFAGAELRHGLGTSLVRLES